MPPSNLWACFFRLVSKVWNYSFDGIFQASSSWLDMYSTIFTRTMDRLQEMTPLNSLKCPQQLARSAFGTLQGQLRDVHDKDTAVPSSNGQWFLMTICTGVEIRGGNFRKDFTGFLVSHPPNNEGNLAVDLRPQWSIWANGIWICYGFMCFEFRWSRDWQGS